jgi:hypothetical protein
MSSRLPAGETLESMASSIDGIESTMKEQEKKVTVSGTTAAEVVRITQKEIK